METGDPNSQVHGAIPFDPLSAVWSPALTAEYIFYGAQRCQQRNFFCFQKSVRIGRESRNCNPLQKRTKQQMSKTYSLSKTRHLDNNPRTLYPGQPCCRGKAYTIFAGPRTGTSIRPIRISTLYYSDTQKYSAVGFVSAPRTLSLSLSSEKICGGSAFGSPTE